jgi:hypothetical protein
MKQENIYSNFHRIALPRPILSTLPMGAPVKELTVIDPPGVPPVGPKHEAVTGNSAWAAGRNELNVLQRGSRLEITADVDLEGLQNLKEILTHYENILKLLGPKT